MKFAFACVLALACDSPRAPDPVVAPLPEPREASVAASTSTSATASASAAPTAPDVDLAGAEAKCANAHGDVLVLSLLTSCPAGKPKNALDCQGSYDGWDLWWGTDTEADAVRRAGCPTAILCERGPFWTEWQRKHAEAARGMIDRAEKRALPRPSGAPPASLRVYSCSF